MIPKTAYFCLAMAAALACSAVLTADDEKGTECPLCPGRESAGHRTWDKLNRPITIDAEDRPLQEVVESIAKQADVTIVMDEKDLAMEGRKPGDPVAITLHDVRAKTALRALLETLHLKADVKLDGRIVVNSSRTSKSLTVRCYPVGDLTTGNYAAFGEVRQATPDDLAQWKELIVSTVGPETWDEVGGAGSVAIHEATRSLVIRQSRKVHAEIAQLLAQVRELHEASVPDPDAAATDEEIRAAMQAKLSDTKLTMSHSDVPLSEVIQDFAAQTTINMLVDQRALMEEGLTSESLVTIEVKDLPARNVLTDLLKPRNLDFVIEGEVVKVTSRLRAMGPVKVVVYPVGDLLAAEDRAKQTVPVGTFLPIADEIQTEIEPELWNDVGGIGSITVHETTDSLVIRQVDSVHKEIQTFLAAKRASRQTE